MLSIKEASEKLGVHWQTVRNYIDRGELKSYKIGKLIKIKSEDLEKFINKDESGEDVNVEIELRYKVKNIKPYEKKLLDIGATLAYHSHIIDHWFLPISIKSQKQHDIWFNKKRGCGIRIREQDNGYTGKVTTSLETKRLTKHMNHNTFLESELNIDSYKKGKAFLQMLDRKEFLTIDKNRIMYKYKNFKIVIDDIKNYGAGIEIELPVKKSRDYTLKQIEQFAKKIGLSEKHRFKVSSTVDAMKKLAKFD